MERAHDGRVVFVARAWSLTAVSAEVIEARFATCTVRYWGGVALYTHDWNDVHLNVQDALNRQRVLNRQTT